MALGFKEMLPVKQGNAEARRNEAKVRRADRAMPMAPANTAIGLAQSPAIRGGVNGRGCRRCLVAMRSQLEKRSQCASRDQQG